MDGKQGIDLDPIIMLPASSLCEVITVQTMEQHASKTHSSFSV